MIWKVTKFIQDASINIATLKSERKEKGKENPMTICLDSILPDSLIKEIENISGMYIMKHRCSGKITFWKTKKLE